MSHIQKYSLQDGPGIRTTVFLKGCPLQCAWCHNPENITPRPEVMVVETRCMRCGACAQVCPQHASQLPVTGRDSGFLGTPLSVDRSVCTVCGACVEACPTGARERIGQPYGVQDLVARILEDRIFYDDSKGGVTFSGGEPLLQFAFLREVLAACRVRGIHTAVDTCGFARQKHLLEVAGLADLLLYDLKFIDEALHARFCGVSNRVILENLQAATRTQSRLWIRIPVIPGVNDAPHEIDAMARFIGSLSGERQVHLLPYHKTGAHKFQRLGQNYQLGHVTPPSAEYMEAVQARFTHFGLNVKIGG